MQDPVRPGCLRIAYLVYRGNPRCGGQGVYTRHLTRELSALGHRVTVFSGPPYPALDEGIELVPAMATGPATGNGAATEAETAASVPTRDGRPRGGIFRIPRDYR